MFACFCSRQRRVKLVVFNKGNDWAQGLRRASFGALRGGRASSGFPGPWEDEGVKGPV